MNIISTQYTLLTQSFELYIAGCTRECKGCFSEETWDFNQGIDYTRWLLDIDLKIVEFNDLIEWIWVLGGEPLQSDHIELCALLTSLQKHKKPIVLFTSYELDEVPDVIKCKCDYIKTGRYRLDCNDEVEHYGIKLQSTNQRIWKNE